VLDQENSWSPFYFLENSWSPGSSLLENSPGELSWRTPGRRVVFAI